MSLLCLPTPLATLARGLIVSALFALPAAAATMQAVYTGTVTNSFDAVGLFGAPGASLDGAAATMTFHYDTTKGILFDDPNGQELVGGTVFATSPVTYAAVTINGVTISFTPTTLGSVNSSNNSSAGGTTTSSGHSAFESAIDLIAPLTFLEYKFSGNIGSVDLSLGIPVDLTQPFTVEVDPQNPKQFHGANFSITVEYDYAGWSETYGSIAVSRVVVTDLAPVPLPAAMPLLVAALAGLGLAARRRRAG